MLFTKEKDDLGGVIVLLKAIPEWLSQIHGSGKLCFSFLNGFWVIHVLRRTQSWVADFGRCRRCF